MANLGVSAPDCKRGVFSTWQQVYAEHGIATFPVTANKAPATKGYLRTGLNGSKQLAQKFLDADAFGFACGRNSKITVVDIDTTDENVVADAIARYGEPPIITRTASGKFHLPYRYNGERRQIRPFPDIDVLGDGGMVIAAPSKISTGIYEFIKGNLDDLDQLKPMRGIVVENNGSPQKGARNKHLWQHCMRQAHHCDDFDALLDVARTYNEDCQPPMEDDEVMKVATSAWKYTERGENRFGQHGAYFPVSEVLAMVEQDQDHDAFVLLAYLRALNGPWAMFMCTNSLHEKFGWTIKRTAAARDRLIEGGYMTRVRRPWRGNAALYQWAN